MQRSVRLLCATALAAACWAVGLPAAGAAPAGGGLLRLAHLSPDTPAVDVYVNSVADPAADLTLHGVSYGDVSDYRDVPPGSYTVSMRKAGAAADTPPVLSTTVEVGADSARTVAGVGHFADLGLRILQDSLTPPPSGDARMRVVAAAATAGSLDVSMPSGQVAKGLAFAHTSDYVDIPAGRTTLTVAPAGGPSAQLPVTVSPGAVYSLLVLDKSGGGLTVRPVLDAASPGVVPTGSVPAGEGGTAPGQQPTVLGPIAAGLAALAVLGLLVTFRVRSPWRRSAARHGRL